MCGRYTSTSSIDELASIFEVDEIRAEPMEPRWNVAPTVPVFAVARTSSGARALGTFRWGLVPSWAKDPSVGNRMINARAEGITVKPAYRAAIARRRCLIPADTFYEWQRRSNSEGRPAGKLPYAVSRVDGRPMAFAGVWEVWRNKEEPDSDLLRSCAIVTTSANSVMAPIHDRMPVILEESDWKRWLDPDTDVTVIEGLMVAAPDDILFAYAITTKVNKVTNEGPELLDPLPPPP